MACKLDRPTPQELFDRIRNNFSANVLGGFDVVPESVEHYVVANDYAMAEEFYSIAEQAFAARDERTACCDDLYEMAARRGFYPRPAGFAQGYVKISGDVGAALPIPLDVRISNQNYRATGTVPTVLPESGFVAVRVQALVPGTDGNIAINNTTGTLTSAAVGIDTDVEVYGTSFCGGSEAESCESFRSRYIDRLAYQPRATMAWLIEKIMEWPCVTRVAQRSGSCCEVQGHGPDCGCNSCINNLEFYPMFDSTFSCGIPPECVITDMNDWLFGNPPGRGLGQVEIGVCGKLYAPVATLVNVRLAGLNCATQAQVALIRERITTLFARAVPSQLFTIRSIESLITQVIGDSENYTVSFEVVSGAMSITPCGDLDPACDVLPCLNDIIFANAYAPQGLC